MTGIEITILCALIALMAVAAALSGVVMFHANRAVLDLRRDLDRWENEPAPDPDNHAKGDTQ